MTQPIRKIAFISPHCLLDFTNGAATATLDALSLLTSSGFDCQAYCSTQLDSWDEALMEEILAQRVIRYVVRNAQIGRFQGRMIFTSHGKVPVTLFNSASTRGGWQSREEIGAFLSGCEIFLRKNRPDVVLTYGGDPVSLLLHRIVRHLGIPLVFALHNFGYLDRSIFAPEDHVVVPTEFARRFYEDAIGLKCQSMPLVLDAARVRVERRNPQFVTFVNPDPRKGIHVFARIAEVLSRRRPDIPLLLVEGAAKANYLSALGIDPAMLKNVKAMPNTPDPRKFYSVTKLLLMPSLMENAGFVAMEAMANGIPVIGSNRGGLPETIADAAPVIDIPARYSTKTCDVPSAEEVEPWVATIERLWDNPAEYARRSAAALKRSEAWSPERLAGTYAEFFGSIARRPSSNRAPARAATVAVTSKTAAIDTVFASGIGREQEQSKRPAPFVTCCWLGQSGRLGNQLFQIAATIGTARKNGLGFIFPPWAYASCFEKAIPQSAQMPETKVYAEPSFAYREIRVCGPTDLAGCFQSERYFKHCEADIRSYFAPCKSLAIGLYLRFSKLLATPTCSVHVRRGDYALYPEYVDLAATNYYERAIASFASDTTFVFFSDDIAWCRARFRDRRFVFVEGQSDIDDLFLMSLCRDHIIANSTFSWWGAWLDARPGKKVIAPARWFAGSYDDPSLPFSSQPYQGYHDSSDIIPPEWIKQ
jgi:glycosyltransferase involved in cell wall biosynthesis